MLSLVAAEEGIALSGRAAMSAIAKKGQAVPKFGLKVIDDFGLTTSTPREASQRGCHLAVHHPNATQLVKNLASQFKVIADARPPDMVRLGLSPLTTRFTDVWDGIERLNRLTNR